MVIRRTGPGFMIDITSECRGQGWMMVPHVLDCRLFAMGQPINGKIVKYNTPKPNAQDVAKLLVRDIQVIAPCGRLLSLS